MNTIKETINYIVKETHVNKEMLIKKEKLTEIGALTITIIYIEMANKIIDILKNTSS